MLPERSTTPAPASSHYPEPLQPLPLHPPYPPCRAVSAYVTHGVFPRDSWQKFKADDSAGASANGGFRQARRGAEGGR